jgi:hypothetical protein
MTNIPPSLNAIRLFGIEVCANRERSRGKDKCQIT